MNGFSWATVIAEHLVHCTVKVEHEGYAVVEHTYYVPDTTGDLLYTKQHDVDRWRVFLDADCDVQLLDKTLTFDVQPTRFALWRARNILTRYGFILFRQNMWVADGQVHMTCRPEFLLKRSRYNWHVFFEPTMQRKVQRRVTKAFVLLGACDKTWYAQKIDTLRRRV